MSRADGHLHAQAHGYKHAQTHGHKYTRTPRPTATPTPTPSARGWLTASQTTIDVGGSTTVRASWEPPGLATWLGFASGSTAVLGRSSQCSGTRFVEPPSEARLTVYGCQGGTGTVELRAGRSTGTVLASITITVRTPPTARGELSATKTAIDVGEEVTVSAVNVVPSDQSVYIVTNGRLGFAGPGTCHFEIGPRSSEKSTRSWTLEGCSPPGSGSVTLKTRHNGNTLVLDSITIDVRTPPTPTPTAVPTATTTDPVVEPTAVTGPTPGTGSPVPPTPGPTSTATPTATPLSALFNAPILYEGRPIETGHWGVLHSADVTIQFTANATANIADYEFKLDLNSSETGFHVNSGTSRCTPSTGATDTGWFTVRFVVIMNVFALTRCGLGDVTNSGMVLKARPIAGGAEFTVTSTGSIPQGWHRSDRQVYYSVDLATLSGSRPSYVPSTYQHERTMTEMAIPRAARSWNSAVGWTILGTIPPHLVLSAVLDVTIKGAWYGTECRKDALGCTSPGEGTYPHIGSQTLWISYPPKGLNAQGKITEWTTNLTRATIDPQRFYYLPMILMHELGHTAGVGHLPPGHVMGPYDKDNLSVSLSDDDRHGIQEATQSHTH